MPCARQGIIRHQRGRYLGTNFYVERRPESGQLRDILVKTIGKKFDAFSKSERH